MRIDEVLDLLRKSGLRETQQRKAVIRLLMEASSPCTAPAIGEELTRLDQGVNTVTVYRVLEALQSIGLVHRHPCNGGYSLCAIPDQHGLHAFLHCTDCGRSEEFCDEQLSQAGAAVAKHRAFHEEQAVAEIHGRCAQCS